MTVTFGSAPETGWAISIRQLSKHTSMVMLELEEQSRPLTITREAERSRWSFRSRRTRR
jgi:hypothetical protein